MLVLRMLGWNLISSLGRTKKRIVLCKVLQHLPHSGRGRAGGA